MYFHLHFIYQMCIPFSVDFSGGHNFKIAFCRIIQHTKKCNF